MSVYKFDNVFTQEELNLILSCIDESEKSEPDYLGKTRVEFKTPDKILQKLNALINTISNDMFVLEGAALIEYNNKNGQPHLPPHFDGDHTELFIDFQLSGNTDWDLGVNKEVYPLQDNSALIFNPNTNIHWRPIKEFKDGEYLKLLFFRAYNPKQIRDHSDIRRGVDDLIFREIVEFRNSLADITKN